MAPTFLFEILFIGWLAEAMVCAPLSRVLSWVRGVERSLLFWNHQMGGQSTTAQGTPTNLWSKPGYERRV